MTGGLAAVPLQATVTETTSDVDSMDVATTADLSITGDALTIVLSRISAAASVKPNEPPASFHFDIVSAGGVRRKR